MQAGREGEREMIQTEYREEIESLLKEGLWVREVSAKLGIPMNEVSRVAEDPATWIDELEYKAMIRGNR